MSFKNIWSGDIEKKTKENTKFRKILKTIPNFQLVVMTLKPGENIGMEVHPNTVQFVRVEKGNGIAILNKGRKEKKIRLKDGMAVIVPPGIYHDFKNTAKRGNLSLYVIYVPPEH